MYRVPCNVLESVNLLKRYSLLFDLFLHRLPNLKARKVGPISLISSTLLLFVDVVFDGVGTLLLLFTTDFTP